MAISLIGPAAVVAGLSGAEQRGGREPNELTVYFAAFS